jgi:flagellar motor switch protein FliG
MPRELAGSQKAALLLMQMSKRDSSRVLKMLSQAEVAEVTAEIARISTVSEATAEGVVEEFLSQVSTRPATTTGGIDVAKSILENSLGKEDAQDIIDAVIAGMGKIPFQFLRQADPRQILSFIQDEHPQTITLVVAHMTAELAALVMGGLSEDLQRDVATRLAVMDRTSPDVVEQVEAQLERKFSSVMQPNELSALGGVQNLVDILNRSDRAMERLILEGLERSSPELADEIRQRMFVFEDIGGLDDRSIQLVLRQVDGKELAVALKGVKADVRDKIGKNMSERAAQNLKEEIDMLGPIRIKTVEEAQGAIVRVIRALEEAGQLVLSRGADEFVL